MAQQSFGNFKSVGEFQKSYKAAEERELAALESELPLDERVRRRRERPRSVVEITATLRHREPDDVDVDQHVRLLVARNNGSWVVGVAN